VTTFPPTASQLPFLRPFSSSLRFWPTWTSLLVPRRTPPFWNPGPGVPHIPASQYEILFYTPPPFFSHWRVRSSFLFVTGRPRTPVWRYDVPAQTSLSLSLRFSPYSAPQRRATTPPFYAGSPFFQPRPFLPPLRLVSCPPRHTNTRRML